MRRAPGDARLQSDLAAAWLEKAGVAGELQDLFSALSRSRHALRLAPSLLEAKLNHALVLERLSLFPAARRAWADFLRAAPESPWTGQAREHLARLAAPSSLAVWSARRRELLDAASAGRLGDAERLVAAFPQQARALAEEELFPEWARLLADGAAEKGRTVLGMLRVLGEALSRVEGDPLVRDSVAVVDRAGGDAAALKRLLDGHLAFGRALVLQQAGDYERARPLWEESRALLARAGAPFQGWAALYAAICDHQHGRYEEELAELAGLERAPGVRRYPNLSARVAWMQGLARTISGDLAPAVRSYERSRRLFLRTGEAENAAVVESYLAEAYLYLGNTGLSAAHLRAALVALPRLQTPRRISSILEQAANAALACREPVAALLLQDGAVEAVQDAGDAPALVHALDRRAVIREELGETDAALRDLDAAQGLVAGVLDEASRDMLAGDLLAHRGRLVGARDPRQAVRLLENALDVYTETNYPLLVPELRLELARAYGDRGEESRELETLLAAEDLVERQRELVDDDAFRADYLNRAQAIFDRLVELEAGQDDAAAAFDHAERGRARALFDRAAAAGAAAAPRRALNEGEVRARMPSGVALIEYAVTEERLFAWVVKRSGSELRELPARRAAIERQVEALRAAVDSGRERELSAMLRSLYASLVAPLGAKLGVGEALVFIPDKALYGVPFAALADGRTGRYLIEDHPVAVAPSASLYVHALGRARELARRPLSAVLAVGEPEPDSELRSLLSPLPYARQEAVRVAALFGGSGPLLGRAATKTHILAAMRRADAVFFAGHALLNLDRPLRSALVLSPDPGSAGSGLLYAQDLYRASFPRTRLVVLAGCSTAEGRVWGREGIASLARPFLAGGVPAVVATLWEVGDRASSVLLEGFSVRLRAGADPLTALTGAQLTLIHHPDERLRSPRRWAAFTLVGGAERPPGHP